MNPSLRAVFGDRQPDSINPPPALRSAMQATLENYTDALLSALEASLPATTPTDPHDFIVGVVSDRGAGVAIAAGKIRDLPGFFPVETIRDAVTWALMACEDDAIPVVVIYQREGTPAVALMRIELRPVELSITSPGGLA